MPSVSAWSARPTKVGSPASSWASSYGTVAALRRSHCRRWRCGSSICDVAREAETSTLIVAGAKADAQRAKQLLK